MPDELNKEELQKLELIAEKVGIVKKSLRIGTNTLTPVNYEEEMEKFLRSGKYNPKFIYNHKKLPNYKKVIDKLKKELDHLDIPSDLKEHLLEVMDDLYVLYKTKSSVGTADFSSHAHNLFNWGTDRLDLLLTNTPHVKFKIHTKHKLRDANYIKNKFEQTLKKYKIDSFTVNLDSFSPHIINVGYNNIALGSSLIRYECNVERLVVHEIESHVLQNENSRRISTPLTEFVKYGNQHLYSEGLAIYNEVHTRKITPIAFETYYFRIKAVRLLHKSFREIFQILAQDLSPNRAYIMTYRVKRGLSDTSQPGGFPKDAAYLLGFHEISNLVSEKFPKKLLYATKSPILSTHLSKYGLIDEKRILTPRF